MQLESITEGDPVVPLPFPLAMTTSKAVVQCYNQLSDIDTTHQSYSDLNGFTYTRLCMCTFCSMRFYHRCRLMYSLPQSSYRTGGIYFKKEFLNAFASSSSSAVLFKLCSFKFLECHPSRLVWAGPWSISYIYNYIYYIDIHNILGFIISLHLENKFLS